MCKCSCKPVMYVYVPENERVRCIRYFERKGEEEERKKRIRKWGEEEK